MFLWQWDWRQRPQHHARQCRAYCKMHSGHQAKATGDQTRSPKITVLCMPSPSRASNESALPCSKVISKKYVKKNNTTGLMSLLEMPIRQHTDTTQRKSIKICATPRLPSRWERCSEKLTWADQLRADFIWIVRRIITFSACFIEENHPNPKLWENSGATRVSVRRVRRRNKLRTAFNSRVLKLCSEKQLGKAIQIWKNTGDPMIAPQDYRIHQSGRVLELQKSASRKHCSRRPLRYFCDGRRKHVKRNAARGQYGTHIWKEAFILIILPKIISLSFAQKNNLIVASWLFSQGETHMARVMRNSGAIRVSVRRVRTKNKVRTARTSNVLKSCGWRRLEMVIQTQKILTVLWLHLKTTKSINADESWSFRTEISAIDPQIYPGTHYSCDCSWGALQKLSRKVNCDFGSQVWGYHKKQKSGIKHTGIRLGSRNPIGNASTLHRLSRQELSWQRK